MGAVLVTLVTGALNTSPTARLVGAAIGAVIPVLVASGSAQGIMASGLITGGALFITYGGFTFFDYARDKPATFPIPAAMPPPAETSSHNSTTEDGLGLEWSPETVTCDSDGCDDLTVTNIGDKLLEIDTIEFIGDAAGEFAPDGDCANRHLQKDEECQISVTFTPSEASGTRSVLLRIHQNFKGPATDITVEGEATGGAPPPPPPTVDLVPETETVECAYEVGGTVVGGQPRDALKIYFTLQLEGANELPSGVLIDARSNRGPRDPRESGGVGPGRYVALPLGSGDYQQQHDVGVRIDPDQEVAESDENNNDFGVRVYVPAQPTSNRRLACSAG
jgi:hypothetical protein